MHAHPHKIGAGLVLGVIATSPAEVACDHAPPCPDGDIAPDDHQHQSELVAAFETAFVAGDADTLSQLLFEDYVDHVPPRGVMLGPQPTGAERVIADSLALSTALPGADLVVESIVTEGVMVHVQVLVRGRHEGAYGRFGPSEAPVDFRIHDRFRVENGQLVEGWRQLDELSVLRAAAVEQPPDAPREQLPARAVSQFAANVALEGVTADADGTLYVSALDLSGPDGLPRPLVARVDLDGTTTTLGNFDVFGGVGAITIAPDGALYANVVTIDPAHKGIWRLNPDGGDARLEIPFPARSAPNGITALDDGSLYVADSTYGLIWRIEPGDTDPTPWLDHELLRARTGVAIAPGANGIQHLGEELYTIVSDKGYVVRVPIENDGSPGPVIIHAQGVPGDDFALAADGTIYFTTHPFNTVVRLSPDGSRQAIIGTEEDGIKGPTAAVITGARTGADALYVVSDGGWFEALLGWSESSDVGPALVELSLP